MSKSVSAVAAGTIGVLLGVGLQTSPPALAQEIPGESRPYFYLWGAPTAGWDEELTGLASQMVWAYAEWPPATIAAIVKQKGDIQLVDPPGPPGPPTSEDHICIVLRNFGHWIWVDPDVLDPVPYANMVSFIDEDDALDPEPDWDGLEPGTSEYLGSLQPWMENGRLAVADWMAQFITHYKSIDGKTPVRFHFDTEVLPAGCCDVNYTRILEAVSLDDRWDTELVPGSKDYLVPSATDKKMSQMYEEAKQLFGWPNVPLIHDDAVDRFEPPNSDQNRKYFLWYWEICQRSIDACMKQCAYDIIQAPNNYPDCLVSNYNHSNMDGSTDTFGWYTGRHDTGQPVNSNNEPPLEATRRDVRGVNDNSSASSLHYWSDFIHTDPGTQQEVRRSAWVIQQAKASGDFSAPVIYPPDPSHWVADDRLQYYLKDWPPADGGRVMLDYGRRAVESIINSPGGSWQQVAPWTAPPWVQFAGYPTTVEDFRDTLAMLRAKRTPEILIWWNDTDQTPAFNWGVVQQIMDWVYIPQLVQIRVLNGTCANCPATVDRLRYTLREPANPSLEHVEVASNNLFDPPQLALQVRFGNMSKPAGSAVTMNLECAVDPAGTSTADDIRAQIYVWTGSTWLFQSQIATNDFPGTSAPGLGFFAPVNAEAPNAGYYDMRRILDAVERHAPNGFMDVKIVLTRTNGSSEGFTARFDLVQLLERPNIAGGSSGLAQGADFNHTLEVTPYDITAFYDAYNAGEPAADFNNDGQVTPQDLTDFTVAYINSP